MMKKVIKKLLAALLAVAMVCAMAIPAFAGTEGDITTWHSFSAFQIFKGDVTGNDTDGFKISNVTWGSNIADDPAAFLDQLKADSTLGTQFQFIDATDANTAQKVLEVISKWDDSDAYSIAFARSVCHYLYPNANATPEPAVKGGGGSDHIHFDEAGYYLVVDTTPFNPGDVDHAYNSFLLMVTRDNWNVSITPKAEKPSVEKKVFDNQDGTSTGVFGSSADHAINEKFQFQLTATLPASTDHAYDYYDTYAVCFKDTLSDGITFDKLDKVEIANGDDGTPQVIDAANYTRTPNGSQSFTLSIDDVKTCARAANLDLNKGATITVTYTAHLNDKAYVNTGSGSTENKNSVQLQYSNNPRPGDYWGTTTKSEVYVFTYQLNNTKRAETENGTPLPGAGFKLYSDEAYEHEVKLYKEGNFYYPIKNALDKTPVEMKSADDGTFNVRGLDAGTYYLKETTTPADFTPCSVIPPVTITANHNGNHVELDSSKLSTTIINKKAGGITLPSTGGIGTTLFYVVGGGLMVAAIVLLVTKKRMENK